MRLKGKSQIDRAIGQRLRAYRLAAGMSQTAVGDHLGVTFQQIQKYEKGVKSTVRRRLGRGDGPAAREARAIVGHQWLWSVTRRVRGVERPSHQQDRDRPQSTVPPAAGGGGQIGLIDGSRVRSKGVT
jgi:DNA-binding XRE family transcriptional regulator